MPTSLPRHPRWPRLSRTVLLAALLAAVPAADPPMPSMSGLDGIAFTVPLPSATTQTAADCTLTETAAGVVVAWPVPAQADTTCIIQRGRSDDDRIHFITIAVVPARDSRYVDPVFLGSHYYRVVQTGQPPESASVIRIDIVADRHQINRIPLPTPANDIVRAPATARSTAAPRVRSAPPATSRYTGGLTGDLVIDTLAFQNESDTPTIYNYWPENNLTYAFAADISPGIRSNMRAIIAMTQRMTCLMFTETQADQRPNLLVKFMSDPNAGVYASTEQGSSTDMTCTRDIFLNPNYDNVSFGGFQGPPGTHGYYTLIHEFGHFLGLAHPWEGAITLPLEQRNCCRTVLDYESHLPTGSRSSTFMPQDLHALHFLYGIPTVQTDNTTYTFTDRPDTYRIGTATYLPNADPTKTYRSTIVDRGGIDTLDFSRLAANSSGYRFDLHSNGWSCAFNQLQANTTDPQFYYTGISLSRSTAIEKVVVSPSNDTIILNDGLNVVMGFAPGRTTGTDTIIGATRADMLDLSAFPSSITQTRNGNDLLVTLNPTSSVVVKDHFAGAPIQIRYRDAVLPVLGFATVSQTSPESARTAAITVNLSQVSTFDTTVQFSFAGTAIAGVDYRAPATMTIPAGSISGSLDLELIDNAAYGADKRLVLGLQQLAFATPGGITTHTLTIANDDARPLVTFQTATTSNPEHTMWPRIQMLLSAPCTEDVTVPITCTGTATRYPAAGTDVYVLASATFHPGQTAIDLIPTVVDDRIAEQNETVVFTLGTPTGGGAGLGAARQHTLTIIDNDRTANGAPVITAAATSTPATVTVDTAATLTVAARDPDGDSLTYAWSMVSGPGTVTFAQPDAPVTTASFSAAGAYRLMVTVSDGQASVPSVVLLNVQQGNQAPIITTAATATPTAITLPGTASLAVTASDPDGNTLTYTWTMVSGPGTVTFAQPDAPTTTASFSAPGAYQLMVDVSDGQASVSSVVDISVQQGNQTPIITTAPTATPASISLATTTSLAVTASDPEGDALTYAWTKVSGPGTVTFAQPDAPATTAIFSAAGNYQLLVTVSDGQTSTQESVRVAVTSADTARLVVNAHHGTVALTPEPVNGRYPLNTVVRATAIPQAGWIFSNWSGACNSTRSLSTVTMDANKTLTATFSRISLMCPKTLVVGEGASSTCTVRLSRRPAEPVTVTLAAAAPVNAQLAIDRTQLVFTADDWNIAQPIIVTAGQDEDALCGSMAVTLTAAGYEDRIVTIHEQDQDGLRALGSTPAMLPVPEAGSAELLVRFIQQPASRVPVRVTRLTGSDPSLSAPATALTFDPANARTGLPTTISAAADQTDITGDRAVFALTAPGYTSTLVQAYEVDDDFVLTTTFVNGQIQRSTNAAPIQAGTVVTLTAIPDPGYVFSRWTGAIDGEDVTTSPATVTMAGNRRVGAVFVRNTVRMAVPVPVTESVDSDEGDTGSELPQDGPATAPAGASAGDTGGGCGVGGLGGLLLGMMALIGLRRRR